VAIGYVVGPESTTADRVAEVPLAHCGSHGLPRLPGSRRVCENHPTRPWKLLGKADVACDCGAEAPYLHCAPPDFHRRPYHPPRRVIADRRDGPCPGCPWPRPWCDPEMELERIIAAAV
jgi:hypothetical protein